MSKAVQRIVGNVGCPWESLVPTGNREAGNASLPNKTAEQKIWRRRADWTIGQSCNDKNTHTRPLHALLFCKRESKFGFLYDHLSQLSVEILAFIKPCVVFVFGTLVCFSGQLVDVQLSYIIFTHTLF